MNVEQVLFKQTEPPLPNKEKTLQNKTKKAGKQTLSTTNYSYLSFTPNSAVLQGLYDYF